MNKLNNTAIPLGKYKNNSLSFYQRRNNFSNRSTNNNKDFR